MMTVAEVSEWRAVGGYTATEAAWLLLDLNAQTTWIGETKDPRRVLSLAFRVRDRFGISDHGNFGTADMIRNAPPTRQRITLAELCMFAAEIGLTPVICNPDAAAREVEPTKPTIETLSAGHPEENTEAIKRALEIEREQKRSGEKPNRIAACRDVVRERFPDHHDPEGKAKGIAAGVRALKRK